MHPGDRAYRNETLKLTDLTVTTDEIRAVTFENCHVVGPAVIALLGGEIRNSGFDGEFDAIAWVVPSSRTRVIGAIALIDCAIVGCRFERVGLAVPEARLAEVRRGFGL